MNEKHFDSLLEKPETLKVDTEVGIELVTLDLRS